MKEAFELYSRQSWQHYLANNQVISPTNTGGSISPGQNTRDTLFFYKVHSSAEYEALQKERIQY